MRKKLLAVAAVVALTAGAALAGCSNSGSGGTASGTHVLTIGMPNNSQTNNSNPFLNTSSARSLGYAFAIYEPLAQVNDTRPANKALPWLATKWNWNQDFTDIKVTARDGVKWSDGKDFTAKDIAYSLQLRKDNAALNAEGIAYGDIKVDGDTVDVTFTTGQFANQLKFLQLFIVPEHIWSKIADPTTDLNAKPIGTGPYVLKTWTSQAVTLDANKTYWGGKLAAPQLRYQSYTGNDTLTTALQTGEIQWSWTFIADYQKVFIDKDPEHNKVFFPAGLGIDQLVLNTTKAPFNDVAVRQALNLVVDRQKAHAIAESGVFPELISVTAIPTPAGDSFISDDFKGQSYKVDVDAAKKVLTDAGYTYKGDQLIGKDGKQVSFQLTDPSGWNDYVTSLNLIGEAAKSIGIATKIVTPDADTWTSNIEQGKFDAALHWTNAGVTPWEMYSNMFDPAYYAPVGQKASWNFGRYQNADAAAAFKAYTDATDDAGRKTALDALQKIYVDQVPALGIDARPAAVDPPPCLG